LAPSSEYYLEAEKQRKGQGDNDEKVAEHCEQNPAETVRHFLSSVQYLSSPKRKQE
jgi:hypothetical protein